MQVLKHTTNVIYCGINDEVHNNRFMGINKILLHILENEMNLWFDIITTMNFAYQYSSIMILASLLGEFSIV